MGGERDGRGEEQNDTGGTKGAGWLDCSRRLQSSNPAAVPQASYLPRSTTSDKFTKFWPVA
jgi:hypothetical protein